MTYAPRSLLDVRSYLASAAQVGLSNFGIVGDANHVRGYHLGKDRIYRIPPGIGDADYSNRLVRDRHALSNAASAIDIKFGSDFELLRSFSLWLVARAKSGAPDCADIREIVYSPDGQTVVRWDREGLPGGGSDSHRFHTHVSYYRDTVAHDYRPVYRFYFEGVAMTEIRAKIEQWNVDAGPVTITTLGTPLDAAGNPDDTMRLGFFDGPPLTGGAPKFALIARSRLSNPVSVHDAAFRSELAAYTPGCSPEQIKAAQMEGRRFEWDRNNPERP